ncbi:hypothetical protein ACHQM5_019674 [Ranunculus cassubicifolius]
MKSITYFTHLVQAILQGKITCMLSVRTMFFFMNLGVDLIRQIVNVNLYVSWKVLVWTAAFISLPVRILNAIPRERLLEMHLRDMQEELENLAWEKKRLVEQLQLAVKDCRIMGTIISELEEENEDALAKIELLENELQDLRYENIRLTEIQANSKWNFTPQDDKSTQTISIYGHNTPTLKIDSPISDRTLMDPLSLVPDEALFEHREEAISRSLFSAILSLVVGMTIWEADDPCMPLVVALLIVVSMSLRSVFQFFSTIKNRPASDAVALLSFNWFVLGTLMYPMLPIIARVLVSLV